jgi:hypothetical protein
MLGMGTGAIETHYHLEESSDSVLTPDFRIVLPGPGEFNLAIRSDSRGNTCISSLAGSTSSVIVAELLGAGTYEVKPLQEAFFRQGKLDSIERPVSDCGCPPPPEPVLRASADPNSVIPEAQAGSKLQLDNSSSPRPSEAIPSTNKSTVPAGDPPSEHQAAHPKGETQVEMEPLVFSGRTRAKAHPTAPPAPVLEAAALPLSLKSADPMPAVVVLPPPDPKRTNKGFLGRVKGLFSSIFH